MGLLSRGAQVRVLPGALPRFARNLRQAVPQSRRVSRSALDANGSESYRARQSFQCFTGIGKQRLEATVDDFVDVVRSMMFGLEIDPRIVDASPVEMLRTKPQRSLRMRHLLPYLVTD